MLLASWSALLVASQLTGSALADLPLTSAQSCADGCNTILSYLTFDDPNPPEAYDYYHTVCAVPLFIQSLYYCVDTYCAPDIIQTGLDKLNHTCLTYAAPGDVLPSYASVKDGVSADALAAVATISSTGDLTEVLEVPTIPDHGYFEIGYDTSHDFSYNVFLAYNFAWTLVGFWGLVLLIGMINRLCELIAYHRKGGESSIQVQSSTAAGLATRTRVWIQRRLVLPATFGKHCQEPIGWCTIPPRLETALLVLFAILNLVFCFPGYHLFSGNLYWPTEKAQLARYVSDRTGQLAIANIPMVWVFAARNDPFLWLTGWSFTTYNRFHRWIARIATAQAVAHSIGYSVSSYYTGNGDYAIEWAEQYWYCGNIATIVMTLGLAASVYKLRASHYDLFLILHIGMAIILLVTLWYHVKIFDGEYNGFIWPCVAIWSLDRLLRIARVVVVSILPRLTKGIRATATYDKETDLIRFDMTDFFPNQKPRPGIFYYVYDPTMLRGYESHPFTLCSWSVGRSLSSTTELQNREVEDKEFRSSVSSASEDALDQKHTLLIRPYEGFTGRLRDKIVAAVAKSGSCQMSLLLEGPYGEVMDLRRFSNVLVVAGGSGITAAISQSQLILSTGNTAMQVVWAAKSREIVDGVCEQELAATAAHANFTMDVYLTADSPANVKVESPYTVRSGRPDIYAAVVDVRAKCRRDLAVVSCGPPAMADATRAAVVRALGEVGPMVDYFNETAGW